VKRLIVNCRTTEEDADLIVEIVRELGGRLVSSRALAG